ADSPVEKLIARALLIPTDETTLTLPREVGLHLRAGALFPEVFVDPPVLEGRQNPVESVSRAAAGQAFTMLRAVEELVKHWAEDPPAVLRNGGLGSVICAEPPKSQRSTKPLPHCSSRWRTPPDSSTPTTGSGVNGCPH